MEISEVIKRREIKSLIHFTRLENLDNILKNGIVPRANLVDENYVYNDDYRYDKKLDYSCFTLSFPNNKMFYKLRKENENNHWAILVFSPDVLLNYDCLFYPCNAADGNVSAQEIELFQGADALENMFYSENRDLYLKDRHPTDVQAEVLVKGNILPKYIRMIVLDCELLIQTYEKKYPNYTFRYCKKNTKLFNTRKAFLYGH
jgi:hypothetical protein